MGTTMSNREVLEVFGDTIIYDLTILLCCSVIIFVVFRCAGCCEAYFKINSNNHIPGISISSKKYAVSLDGKHVYDCAFEPQGTLSSIRQFIQRKAIRTRKDFEVTNIFSNLIDENRNGFRNKYEHILKTKEYAATILECEQNLLRLLPSEIIFILANGQPVPRNKESQWKLQYTMKEGFIRLSTPKNIHNFGNTTIPWAICVPQI